MQVNMSSISQITNSRVINPEESINFHMEPLTNFDDVHIHRRNSDKISYNQNTTSRSFYSNNQNGELMGLDLNKFMQGNLDETMHEISQSNDIPIIQEINEQHSAIKGAIAKRFNSLKMVLNWWSQSDIAATVNALNLMKDNTVIADFFNFALVSREDVYKLPFNLEHGLSLLPHVMNLIKAKYEPYNLTGVKTGLVLLRLLNEKIQILKSNNYGDDKLKKIEQIVELFSKIFQCPNLDKLRKKTKSTSLSQAADSLNTDLEFFLKPYKR